MKFGPSLLVGLAALLPFLGVVVSENARLDYFQSIPQPFEKAIAFSGLMANKGGNPVTHFSPDGEFLTLFPKSYIDFEGDRRILEGEIFFSSQFIKEQVFNKAKSSFQADQDFSKTEIQVGQLRVGPVIVNAPGASIFIQRDPIEEKSNIYALDRSIEIFINYSDIPFVLPAGKSVVINEKIVTNKTGKLYYTKLKKELRMKSFDEQIMSQEGGLLSKKRVELSLEALRGKLKEIKELAQKSPQTWSWFNSQKVSGGISRFTKSLQANLALGYSEEQKGQLKFEKLVQPLIEANQAAMDNRPEQAAKFLQDFDQIFNSKEWLSVLYESGLEGEWKDFEQAQKAWLRTIYGDDPYHVFIDFWRDDSQINSFADIEKEFNFVENLVAIKNLKGALKELESIEKTLTSISTSPDDKNRITKIRRILAEMLKSRKFFLTKDTFKLYGDLIDKEVKSYTNTQKREEIRLESAQDILLFLKSFLGNEQESEISNLLVKIYLFLDIDDLTQKRGRNIFNEEELETITYIGRVGSSGLTAESIKSLKDKQAYEKSLEERRNRIEKESNEEVFVRQYEVYDNFSLSEKLEEIGVETRRIQIREIEPGETYQFSSGQFLVFPVSGTFQVSNQKFKSIRVGEESENALNAQQAGSFLNQVGKDYQDKLKSQNQGNENFIPQKTQRAILERDLVKESFEAENVLINLEDIAVLDVNFDRFNIDQAIYRDRVRINFIYAARTDSVQNLRIQLGQGSLEISESIKRDDFAKTIEREIFKASQ